MRPRPSYSRILPALLIAALAAGFGCAQEVGDIDRTNPNKLEKRDFSGTWYYRQTIKDVPSTSPWFFTGNTSTTEKINWEISEDSLMAYRAYELVPGADGHNTVTGPNTTATDAPEGYNPVECAGSEEDCRNFKESPVAAFSIKQHFDVQRSYNSQTGEQSNVLTENASDRYWNEREYMRVDWSNNALDNTMLFDGASIIQYTHYRGDEDPLANSVVQKYDDEGNMNYLEVTVQAILKPSYYCYYYYEMDCGPVEVEVVHSFARVPDEPTYEPVYYDNLDMAKFGYFRNVRAAYDRKRGYRRSNLIYLADRHNIFKTAYNADGSLIPLKDRELKPVVYYINEDMPEALWPYNLEIEASYDEAFKQTAAAITGRDISEIPRMFVVCHNPVIDEDNIACGGTGTYAGPGDVRYNHMFWVAEPSPNGPLGYGPSATDPETGEIISGTAYVYGGSIDTYAQYALDIVNLTLACEADEESSACQQHIDDLTSGRETQTDILSRLKPGIDPRANLGEAGDLPITPTADFREFLADKGEIAERFTAAKRTLMPYDPGFEERRVEQIKDNNFDLMLMDQDYVRQATLGEYDDVGQLPNDVLDAIRPTNTLMSPSRLRGFTESKARHFAERNILDSSFVDDRVLGLALSVKDEAKALPEGERQEYLWQRLRGLIYKGVILHELGHTMGLRHNFQGSYDSLNYFDEYWKLRPENLNPNIATVADLFGQETVTENQRLGRVVDGDNITQLDGGIAEYQYSSIMDYGFGFNADIHGLGKYDMAALLYGYSYGYDGREVDGKPVADRGYVNVFKPEAFANASKDQDTVVNLGPSPSIMEQIFRQYNARTSLAYGQLFDEIHYSEVIGLMGDREATDPVEVARLGAEAIGKRTLAKYDDILDARESGDTSGPVEVPFMFCTDDWVMVDSSCNRWDKGADPYEQAINYYRAYKDYYYFSNFARDSLNFSPYSLIGRTFSRYLMPLTNIYQQIFFSQDAGWQGTYRWLAAHVGLNLMAEILTTPRYGDHVTDKDGYLIHCWDSDDTAFQEDGHTTSTDEKCWGDNAQPDLTVPMGAGRNPWSVYDYASGHEYYYWPTEAGNFYDYYAALVAMGSSQAVVRDVDVQTDSLSYSIPYYLLWDTSLNKLFNSLWMEVPERFGAKMAVDGDGNMKVAPHVLEGVQLTNDPVQFDPTTGQELVDGFDNTSGLSPQIRPYHTYGNRFYALLFGMAYFSSNLNLGYAENNQVFRIGNGEQVSPGPGFDLVTCVDPVNGHTYAALDNLNSDEPTAATELVKGCQAMVDDYLLHPSDSGRYYEVQNRIEKLNTMRSFYGIFGSVY